MKNFYKIGFFILLLVFIGGGAYYTGQSRKAQVIQSPTPTASQQIFVTAQPTATVSLSQPASPQQYTRAQVKENVQAAITTGNTQAIEGYMTDNVFYVIQASECCGSMTRAKAVSELTGYIKEAKAPWNFDDTNPIAVKLRANNESPYYGDANSIIGIASNEYTVAFILNAENKIKGVTAAVTYKLVVN